MRECVFILDSILLKPAFSRTSGSALHCEVLITFQSSVSHFNTTGIHIEHGVINDYYSIGLTTWVIIISPLYTGLVRVYTSAGAFTDDKGRISLASDVFSLNVVNQPTTCLFLAPMSVFRQLRIQVRVVCETVLEPLITDFSVKNAKISMLNLNNTSNSVFLTLEPTKVSATITIDFTTSYKSSQNVKSSPVYITYNNAVKLASFQQPNAKNIWITYDVQLVSSTVVYLVSFGSYSNVTSSHPQWVMTEPAADVFCVSREYANGLTAFKLYVIAPYDQTVLVTTPAGSLVDSSGNMIEPVSTTLSVVSLRPQPEVTVSATDTPFTFNVNVAFPVSMEITGSSALSILSSRSTMGSASVNVLHVGRKIVRYSISFLQEGTGWVYVLGGAASTYSSVPCLGTERVEIVVKEPHFAFTSTLDAVTRVYTREVCFRLEAEGLVQEIHSDDLHVTGCDTVKFVSGSVGEQTVVDVCVDVREEGEFAMEIPKGTISLVNRTLNAFWGVLLVWKQGENGVLS